MSKVLLQIGLAVLLAGCSRDGSRPVSTPGPAEDEAQVYAAVVKAWYIESTKYVGGPVKLLLLREESSSQLDRFREYRGEMRGISRDTLDNFQARNEHPSGIPDNLELGVKVAFLAERELQRLVPVKDGIPDWSPFYARYTDAAGVIRLSRVGFNAVRTEALVEVGRDCGSGCGEGAFVFLRRDGGTWKVVDSYGGWMS